MAQRPKGKRFEPPKTKAKGKKGPAKGLESFAMREKMPGKDGRYC